MRNLSSSSSIKQSVSRGMKRGIGTAEEDQLLSSYINQHGEGQWRTLPGRAGLVRCGKSCRLRWMNYLHPCIQRGHIETDEEDLIPRLLGNRIVGRRTYNEIKNYQNTHLSKKLISQGIDPTTHRPLESSTITSQNPIYAAHHHNNNNNNNNIYAAYSSSSRLPADHHLDISISKTITTASVSPAQWVKMDQEYYYGGMDVDNDHQFDLNITVGKAKGPPSNIDNYGDEDVFLSSLINYEQLFNQHAEEPAADTCSHAFA